MEINKEVDYKKIVLNFLNKCKINCDSFDNLDGIIIDRNLLITSQIYNDVKPNILELKNLLNSSVYTSMQKNAVDNHRWPLLNLVRQILRRYNYDLKPKRQADGYTKDGKKKYKRSFEIKKREKKD